MGKSLSGKELGKGITQRDDGRYMGRFTDREGKRQTIYDMDLKKLKIKLEKAIQEAESGVIGDGSKITLNEWFESWMEIYKIPETKVTTQQKLRAYHESRVASSKLGKMYIKDIRPSDVQRFINGLKGELKPGTISNIRSQLNDMFDKALLNGYILKNPCVGLVMPKKQKREARVLTIEEQKKFLEYSSNYAHFNVFRLGLTTGMRIGEILGLKWDDINFDEKTITINKTLHYMKDTRCDESAKFFYTSAKTSASNRKIPINSETVMILKDQKLQQNKKRMLNSRTWRQDSGFENLVFTSPQGGPVSYHNIETKIKECIWKINSIEIEQAKEEGRKPQIIETFTAHTLRHTFSTRCHEQGMPDKVIQNLLGHEKQETTTSIYIHEDKNRLVGEIEKVKFIV